jgi:hypothetical protein
MEYQQNVTNAPLGVIVIHASSNDIVDLKPLMPRVLESIPAAKRGQVINIK